VPSAHLLYGGCLLKSTTAPSLGNLEDASLEHWPVALRKLREAFPDAQIQVPGHGAVSGDANAASQALLAGSVTLSGGGLKAMTLDAAALAKLPRVTVKASDHGKDVSFEGVPLAELLKAAGAPLGEALRGDRARLALVATGADGYRAVFALAELDPAFADRGVILADRRDGQPLSAKEGPFRLVAPGEARQARWVRQLSALTLKPVE
jgi:DMSO/TMAO reductase YedYZ molybdopterin-dependent catalytic subunit